MKRIILELFNALLLDENGISDLQYSRLRQLMFQAERDGLFTEKDLKHMFSRVKVIDDDAHLRRYQLDSMVEVRLN